MHRPGWRRHAPVAVLVLTLAVSLCAGATGCASTSTTGTVVSDAYASRALDGGTTAVYFTVTNSAPARLTRISTDAGGTAGFYRSAEDDDMGMSSMDSLESLELSKGALFLEPGGTHVMAGPVIGELRAGDEIEVTLAFDDGRQQTLTALVRSFGDIAAMPSNNEGQSR